MVGLPALRTHGGNTTSSITSLPSGLSGGFTVDDGCHRALDQQATRLGFADLRGCLQALLEDGWSIPQLATHLHTTQPVIRRAITDHPHPQPSRRQQPARQRQRAAQQRAGDRVAKLGFDGVRAYLVDRLATKAWALRQVEGELGAALSLCGGCWTSTRSGGWRRPGGSEPLPQRPGALSSRRGRSSNAATHAYETRLRNAGAVPAGPVSHPRLAAACRARKSRFIMLQPRDTRG